MEGILPIRGVDGSTGEAIPIAGAPSLREADDPFRTDVVRWAALDVPSIMVEEDLTKLGEAYRIPADIELMLPGPNERAYFPRRGCTTLHLNAFMSGMRLPLHPILFTSRGSCRRIRAGRRKRVVLFLSLGSHKPLVTGCPSSIKQWKESWFWVSGNWQRVFDDPELDLDVPSFYGIANTLPRCELSRDVVDIVRSIYQAAPLTRSYGLILNRHRCLVELGLMAFKEEASSANARSFNEAEAQGSGTRLCRRYFAEEGHRGPEWIGQRTLSVNPSSEVVLDSPPRVDPVSGSSGVGPFDSRKKLRELIGPPGSRIFDDTLKNVPFFPSMGAQAVKKYFTPKWEEFTSHGELEDVLEAGLAAAVRATGLQLKVLEEFRTCMQEHKKLVTEASKSDKEHQQALEGLQASVDSMRMAYKQLQADLRKSDSNVLQLTKKLDNANAAQKVAAEALKATNIEKRRLQSEYESSELEAQRLRGDLKVSEKGRTEAEVEVARLLGEKKEMEAKLESVEADFIANFHNTEAYTNFSDYFARGGAPGGIGHVESQTSRPRPWTHWSLVPSPRGRG
ncbi:putative abhydrolase domain-containing protein [Abeliophyllum distichum]|uniref:Abhydrolase domain-containing protein n=1 Tax=Abeliophyllum distichum TaxID=126358 RepID=A0ABD1REK5_9LAMI